jgi:hypothetical protein
MLEGREEVQADDTSELRRSLCIPGDSTGQMERNGAHRISEAYPSLALFLRFYGSCKAKVCYLQHSVVGN